MGNGLTVFIAGAVIGVDSGLGEATVGVVAEETTVCLDGAAMVDFNSVGTGVVAGAVTGDLISDFGTAATVGAEVGVCGAATGDGLDATLGPGFVVVDAVPDRLSTLSFSADMFF